MPIQFEKSKIRTKILIQHLKDAFHYTYMYYLFVLYITRIHFQSVADEHFRKRFPFLTQLKTL